MNNIEKAICFFLSFARKIEKKGNLKKEIKIMETSLDYLCDLKKFRILDNGDTLDIVVKINKRIFENKLELRR